MRNKQAQLLFGICGIQTVGIACMAAGVQAGLALAGAGIVLLIADAVGILRQSRNEKICPECRTAIPEESRICPECGYRYKDGVPVDELTEYIEQEKEKAMTSEKIDCDFEKIEAFALEELEAYDGDIEEFLKNRCKGDN